MTILSVVFQACSSPEEKFQARLAEAQAAMDAENPAEAIVILNEVDQQTPDRLEVVEFLAFAHARNNNPSASADAFIRAHQLSPGHGEFLLFAGQAREEAGDLDQASDHYRLYVTEHYEDFTGWQALARAEEKRLRHRDALDAYLQVYRLQPSGETAAAIGTLFFQLRNVAQAHHWFTVAREKHQDGGAPALLGLLRVILTEERWERAEELVALLDKEHPGALDDSDLAMVRGELQRWRESVAEMERIREEQLAEARRREEEEKRREEEARIAREKAEEEARKQAELAAQAKAEAEAQEEEAEEPGVLAEADVLEIEVEVQVEEPPPPNPYADLIAEAQRLEEAGRYGTAARTYWQALSHEDSDPETWFNLSYAHYRARSWNDAELTALEAIRRDPENERYHLHYLNVVKETKPVRSYLRELERIHELFPRNREIVLALANTYAKSQHSRQVAVRYYQHFLQLAPNDTRRPEVEASIRRLTM